MEAAEEQPESQAELMRQRSLCVNSTDEGARSFLSSFGIEDRGGGRTLDGTRTSNQLEDIQTEKEELQGWGHG